MSLSLQKLKKRTPPKVDEKPARKVGRFDGLSEEEVKKNTLNDILEPNLDLVFVGINPSLMAAHTGRYYAGPGNHFYKLLYESKLIPEPITYEKDDSLLQYKIGLTNVVARATCSSANLSKSEIKKGAMLVQDKLKRFKPKIAVFNGKCIYEEFDNKYDKSSFRFGLQPHRIGETALWVVPSSSARCANFPRMQDKLHFYTSLKTYLAFLKDEIKEVNLEEFCFEGRCRQAIPTTSKMWRRKGISAFTKGGRIVNKETICMDTSEENILAIPKSIEFIVKDKNKNNDDLEKDSGISVCSNSQSDNFQLPQNEVNENDSIQKTNLRSKKRQKNKNINQKKIQSRPIGNKSVKERSETIDFVSLIKHRLTTKGLGEPTENENDKEDCPKIDSFSQSNANNLGLKYENLRSRRLKYIFEVKSLDDNKNDN